ncbi:hypothetical protein [Paracoccus aerodenitrificans]|uniref:hypothetical protein n=1 Tax=Paracoccus aerodenitrificans TaxID=3017781 RepID=UPI0022F0D857|nr:hypothetical protein [Paracoccus aerodenitrificans]WBU63963.1 hypothetical protein PAE61_16785 [Paracoccus aerodenitrificans]
MSDFNSFVIFAGMRTGSNLLEASLNAIKHVTCFGEAFNPYMLGWPNTDQIRGVTMDEREADPHRLLNSITERESHLSGFRYFHDHDPRVLDAILQNHRCAKIILSRNPLDSYVSTELARKTNQWKLNETERPIAAAIEYDSEAFRQMLAATQGFQSRVLHALQASGQTPFLLHYDDLRDSEVLTGLLHWLGRKDLEKVEAASDQVPQNPRDMSQKVTNFAEMQHDLASLDPFRLSRIPSFEPQRGPAVPSFIATEAGHGLIYMPVRGGPTAAIINWMKSAGDTQSDFNQNRLRRWLREHPGHRSFTVLRHPLFRAWAAFTHLLENSEPALRQNLRDIHRLEIPVNSSDAPLTEENQIQIFPEFIAFLRRNLQGQTSLPVLPIWASQSEVLAGFAKFRSPDVVLRETDLADDLDWLARSANIDPVPPLVSNENIPDFLNDPALQSAARSAYQKDYVQFGFSGEIPTDR